ncbi:hypothetical protein Vadar_006635 [Vaccinium darrowii]|uniref:Uncharacterized protein n=1 Tax=Vaccinium darrowii TaxID=229202 RepID=A0ACB7XX63_9ERIC|nr:hypothetical protein Vadar_006635 [Vaccinium darrowii]
MAIDRQYDKYHDRAERTHGRSDDRRSYHSKRDRMPNPDYDKSTRKELVRVLLRRRDHDQRHNQEHSQKRTREPTPDKKHARSHRERSPRRSRKDDMEDIRNDINNIQQTKYGKSKDPLQNSYKGPRSQEFKGIVTVFKEPLHELLKKIKNEEWFKLAPKNAPKPPVKDLKYQCRFHNSKGHVTTWCPQFKEYLEEKVAEGKLADFIDLEKTRTKAERGQNTNDLKGDDLIDVQVIHEYEDANAEQRIHEELKVFVNAAKEVMSVQQLINKLKPHNGEKWQITFTEKDLNNVRQPHCDALVLTIRIGRCRVH